MANQDNPLRDIVINDAGNGHFWCQYDEFKMLMKADGYANMSKLCSSIKHGKEVREWLDISSAKEIIEALSTSRGIPREVLVYKITNGPNDYRGYYAHPRLIPAITSWACPKFALKAGDIVNEFINREAREAREAEERRKDAELARKDGVIVEKECKIDSLEAMLRDMKLELAANHAEIVGLHSKQLDKTNEALAELKISNTKLDETNIKLDTVIEVSDVINERLEEVEYKLDTVKANVVPVAQRANTLEMFCLLKRGKYDPTTEYQYYTVCGQVKYVKNTRSSLIRKEGMHEILCIEYTPNTKNILHRIKDELDEQISYRGNKIDLIDITEVDFIKAINKINDEKFKICEV